jgi:hypothetical protein
MPQAKSDRYASSLYVGGLDRAGLPYIGRIFWSFILRVSLQWPILTDRIDLPSTESFGTRVCTSHGRRTRSRFWLHIQL